MLSTTDELEAAIAASFTRPILIFKHSATCGTSAMAAEEVEDLVAGEPVGADVYVVRIQATRALSNEIERRFRIRHESPQVLLVRDGVVAWSATHWGVTADAIQTAIARATP